MKVSKYRITVNNHEGSGIIVYHDDVFYSFIGEFKPPLNAQKLLWLQSHIPAAEMMLAETLVLPAKGTVQLEHLSVLSNNQVLALFCEMYEAKTRTKYKVSAPDAGKITALCKDAIKWRDLLQCYFASENFLFKGKYSVANLTKYFNELNAEAFGVKPVKTFPLPYDQDYFARLGTNEQRAYWDYLRANGYAFEQSAGRGGKWVKKENLMSK